MKRKAIIFFPSKTNHWQTYLPLLEPLMGHGFDVRFFHIPQYFKEGTVQPPDDKVDHTLLWPPPKQSRPMKGYGRFKSFYQIKRKLMPAWNNFLKTFSGGAVVVAQDGAPIQRMILNTAKQNGFATVTIQDGYFVSEPTAYGWALEGKRRLLVKRLLSCTPLEKFIAVGFGSVSDYCGLYGEKVREKYVEKGILLADRATVIGSPRFLRFKENVAALQNSRKDKRLRILCLPTTFPMYRDTLLDKSQDMALDWLCGALEALKKKDNREVLIEIKVKRGYDHLMKRYDDLFRNRGANVLGGNQNLAALMARADAVITTGSTAALEASVCGIPVIQVMPSRLYERYMKISGLPVAKTFDEVLFFLDAALTDKEHFMMEYCRDVSRELADIDSGWNSIDKAQDWILNIVNEQRK